MGGLIILPDLVWVNGLLETALGSWSLRVGSCVTSAVVFDCSGVCCSLWGWTSVCFNGFGAGLGKLS